MSLIETMVADLVNFLKWLFLCETLGYRYEKNAIASQIILWTFFMSGIFRNQIFKAVKNYVTEKHRS